MMICPATYGAVLPDSVLEILPWPSRPIVYFAVSVFVLPMLAAESEVRQAAGDKAMGENGREMVE